MANDRFYADIDGLEELFKQLENMGKNGEKAAKKALREGGKVFKKLAIAGVPYSKRKSDKHLKDAIDVSPVKVDEAGNSYVSVGTYLGKGKYRNGVYWGAILEGGHKIVTKQGKQVGFVSAKPWMQPAFERGQGEATKVMSEIIYKAMGL